MVKIHYAYHTGANCRYISQVLALMNNDDYDVEVTRLKLNDFVKYRVPVGTDVLLYQTFPNENHKGKFNSPLIKDTDQIFKEFKGLKILVDVNDNGDIDSFSRFQNPKLPRIKCYPTKWFMGNYNVILKSSASIATDEKIYQDKYDRDILISCKFGRKKYHHVIRYCVEQMLKKDFADKTDFNWVDGKENYLAELRRTMITVGAPGWGRHNASYTGALKAGSLLFAHRTLEDCYLLPHKKLIEWVDYVSYDLFNFKYKLQYLLDHPEDVYRIRTVGRQTFYQGFDYKKSADKFYAYLNRELK